MRKKECPLGVKIISLNYYVVGFVFVFMALSLGFMSGLFYKMMSFIGIVAGGMFTYVALIVGVVGFVNIIIGYHLWIGKQWARIVVIFISLIHIFGLLVRLWLLFFVGNIFVILIHVIIAGYLLGSDKAKKCFK